MVIIPAIDIKDGHCVRLRQGDMEDATVFSEDPVAMARHWLEQGAKRLHLVDLNGARAGVPKNEKVIRAICKAVGEDIPVQLGAHPRHGHDRALPRRRRPVRDHRHRGVKNPGLVHDACAAFQGHIIVGIDAKDGKVAVEGGPR